MHIFIDETGSFTGLGSGSSPSLVGALIIPDAKLPDIRKRYDKIRRSLPKSSGEVKGRLLNEQQVAEIVDLLRRNEALFEATLIDTGMHTENGIRRHIAGQADAMTRNLTDEHHPSIHEGIGRWREQLEALPLQLYIQSQATFELIDRVVQHATMYFSQRRPQELGAFHWIIDAKDKGRTATNWEAWWSKVILPMMQSRSFKKPHGRLREGDYSHFSRFYSETGISDYFKPLIDNLPNDPPPPIDLKKLMTESFRFSSQSEMGLELVDVVTNAVRRAVRGNLQQDGWDGIPSIMIHRRQHYIELISLERLDSNVIDQRYRSIMSAFATGGRSMLAPRFSR